jgi:peptidoglycan/xylan/chitin deacetylase (PgdA/CDA1 family)
MPRKNSSYFPAGRSSRSDLTRRGLLGAAAVIAGAGVADVLHRSGHGSGSKTAVDDAGSPTVPVVRKTTSSAKPSNSAHPRTSATPTHSHSPETSHTHPPTGQHKAGHGKGPAHGHADAHLRAEEHVNLPASSLRVRNTPVYYVDDLIKDAPPHAIALTVDDGPDPLYTPKVLKLLDKYQMQASFCIVGVHAEAYPGLIRDIARAGHAIVNHSYTHVQPFNEQSEKRVVSEITLAQRAIEKAAKVTPHLFRAPGGAWSHFIYRAVAAYDLVPLDWDIDPRDWAMPGTTRIERAMLKARPNDIVLCHDGGGDRSETVRALRKVLPDWKRRGYDTIPLLVPPKQLAATRTPASPTQSSTPTTSPSTQSSTTSSP